MIFATPPRRGAKVSLVAAALLLVGSIVRPADVAPGKPIEALVFAPHPDDEVIGCAAVMLRAHQRQQRVGIVLLTNGDGYPALAAAAAKKQVDALTPGDFMQLGALRQQHSLTAAARLGVKRDELIFLGYPDSGLQAMYEATEPTAFAQMFTKKAATYGVTQRDYHSTAHGKPAAYLKANLIADVAEIIRKNRPREIYVTNEADKHRDHRTAFWFVRDAARAAGYGGPIYTYVAHGQGPAAPPDRRVVLTQEELALKRAALLDHQAGTSPIHDQLASEYTKPEEVFWRVEIAPEKK